MATGSQVKVKHKPAAAPAASAAEPVATTTPAAANGAATPSGIARQPSGPGEVLGDVAWLMTHSPMHKHLFIADLEWLVLPPVMAKQFRIFRNGSRPVAFACWAYLDEEAEKRLLSGQPRLRPGDWRTGERAWLIDVVAPFGGVGDVLANLKQTNFKDQPLMALRPQPDGKGMAAFEVKAEAKPATAA